MKARTVYGQFDLQSGVALDYTDPCRELSDVYAGKHGTAESELLESILGHELGGVCAATAELPASTACRSRTSCPLRVRTGLGSRLN